MACGSGFAGAAAAVAALPRFGNPFMVAPSAATVPAVVMKSLRLGDLGEGPLGILSLACGGLRRGMVPTARALYAGKLGQRFRNTGHPLQLLLNFPTMKRLGFVSSFQPVQSVFRIATVLLICLFGMAAAGDEIKSPNGNLALTFALQSGGVPTYSLTYK